MYLLVPSLECWVGKDSLVSYRKSVPILECRALIQVPDPECRMHSAVGYRGSERAGTTFTHVQMQLQIVVLYITNSRVGLN